MIKRIFDILFSLFGIIFLSPLFIPCLFLVWVQDFHSPFYIAPRVGKNGKVFKMVKIRSMIINADKTGVDSTSSDDMRITSVGKVIRKLKLDELSQLWNVLIGDMSLVGPRPNVKSETDLYTKIEKNLLKVKPGITDFSSIVFSDEGDILSGSDDPDLLYNQLIRPWKSRLSLFYIEKSGLLIDIKLILLTVLSILNREKALQALSKILKSYGADDKLIKISKRKDKLLPYPPPGSDSIVYDRFSE